MEGNGRRSRGKATTPDGAPDVGTFLRTTRRRRRISLDRAVRETCIPRRYIEALERNLPVGAFPGALYARGFLRAYARYLRVADEEALLARFDIGDPVAIELPEDAVPPPAVRRRKTRIVVLTMALLASATIVATSGSSHPIRTGLPGAPPPTFAAPPPAEVKPPVTDVVAPTTPALTLEVTGGRSWIRVVADGVAVVRGRTVGPDFRRQFTALRSLEITAGNAAAVRLLFGNTTRDSLGAPGSVVVISVTLKDGVPVLRVRESA